MAGSGRKSAPPGPGNRRGASWTAIRPSIRGSRSEITQRVRFVLSGMRRGRQMGGGASPADTVRCVSFWVAETVSSSACPCGEADEYRVPRSDAGNLTNHGSAHGVALTQGLGHGGPGGSPREGTPCAIRDPVQPSDGAALDHGATGLSIGGNNYLDSEIADVSHDGADGQRLRRKEMLPAARMTVRGREFRCAR